MRKFMKPMMLMLVLCAMVFAGSTMDVKAAKNPFTDVKSGRYYYEPVMWAVEKGVTNGVSATSFGVGQTCTKSQAITFLWRTMGKPAAPELAANQILYKDVSTSSFYYKPLLWSEQNMIASGTDRTTFSPNEVITRGDFVLYLYRMMGAPEVNVANPFADMDESDPYYDAALWAVKMGITNGTSDTEFAGDKPLLREQVVTFLYRARNLKPAALKTDYIDASAYGLAPQAGGYENTQVLQYLVNTVSANGGGTIYIPAGTYVFFQNNIEIANDTHCIKPASNVTIIGDGEKTILKPTGTTKPGLDMFFFNNYIDMKKGYMPAGSPLYLENCTFEKFVVDGADAHCKSYTTAGKAFMINLFKNCYWKDMIVKNTDGTGFGVDCPVGGSMENCIAINCGKAANESHGGASGFGIGFGYSEDEYFTIKNCESYNNKKFGYFYEHQGRFNANNYTAKSAIKLEVVDCYAEGSLYNYGGLYTNDTVFENCVSKNARDHGFFLENSRNCKIINCKSYEESNASFVILQSDRVQGNKDVYNIVYDNCESYDTPYGAKVRAMASTGTVYGNVIKDCTFENVGVNTMYTTGNMGSLTLTGNVTDNNTNTLSAVVADFVNKNNSWN